MIFLLILDWKLTLITLVIVPVAMLVIIPIGKQMHKISKATQDENARFTGILSKVLMEIRLVKSSNAEEKEYQNGRSGIQNLLHFRHQGRKIPGDPFRITELESQKKIRFTTLNDSSNRINPETERLKEAAWDCLS